MKALSRSFKSANYIIEADISKCFDTIDYAKLLEIIKERIKCDKTLALIKSLLVAGFVDMGGPPKGARVMGKLNPVEGGSILNPLLCNIYLHKLDEFLTKKKAVFNKGGA